MHLEQYALTLANHEQVAYQAFADALLIIPKILAINAAQVMLSDPRTPSSLSRDFAPRTLPHRLTPRKLLRRALDWTC